MGRVADKHFQTKYEERENFDVFDKCQLMEQQMRNELTYINKLSNLTFGRDAAPECKTDLSTLLMNISTAKKPDVSIKKLQSNETIGMKKNRYKNKNSIAYPGVNENVLKDMVTTVKPPEYVERVENCNPKKKQKLQKKCKSSSIKNNTLDASAVKKEPGTSLSKPKESFPDVDSSSDCSSINSDELTDTDDHYGEMVLRMLENVDNINE